MILNGELPTSVASLYTVRANSPQLEVTLLRVVNETALDATFTLYINMNGTRRAITPISTQLSAGSCFDDFPIFQIAQTASIDGIASIAGVSWTINVA